MAGRYSVEDLLKLRASPLICKPSNLPAIEELISASEANTKRPTTRGKQEDTTNQTEGFQKRPLLDAHPKKSAADPERIVLGPPRRSFASANARTLGKTGQEGTDEIVNTKEKPGFRERSKPSESNEGKPFDRYSTDTNGRYSTRQERDGQGDRSRRKYDDDDTESKPRREYDRERPKWASKEDQDALENDKAEDSARLPRRDTQSRAKFEQPWFRSDRGPDTIEDSKRDGDRPEWRRGAGREKEWDRSARVEADPEWMVEPARDEPVQVHTQEEFQRWKERMKAGGATPIETKADYSSATLNKSEDKSAKQVFAVEADDSMDKFLARFNEAKVTLEPKSATTKAPAKSKFASLFSPQAESQPKQTPPPMPILPEPVEPPAVKEKSTPVPSGTPSNMEADQAGFARILEMLSTRHANQQAQIHDTKPKTPLYARDSQSKPEAEHSSPAQGLMSLLGQKPSSQSSAPQPKSPVGQDRSISSKSPSESTHARQQSNKDELLLNLLRQASLAPKPTPMPHHHEQRPPPGLFSSLDTTNRAAMNRNQMISPLQGPEPNMLQHRDPGRGMFDEPPIRYQEDTGPHEPLTRRPTNGAPPPLPHFFDDPYLAGLRQGNPQQSQSKQQGPPPPPPPGLGRPPGFEQMQRGPPPPLQGWPGQMPPPPQQSQQQPPRQPPLPPNMNNIPRNMPMQYGGSNMPLPPPPQQQQQQQQNPNQPSQRPPPHQRQFGGEPGMPPNFPPGMGPPLGFMVNGPPPGFGGPLPPPGYGGFRGERDQPQGAREAFMEMYGDPGRSGMRGGGNGDGGMPRYK